MGCGLKEFFLKKNWGAFNHGEETKDIWINETDFKETVNVILSVEGI